MLTSTVIRLRARGTGTLPRAMGEYGHAAFLSLIGTVAPDLAQALHDGRTRHPYTVSPLFGGKRTRSGVLVRPSHDYWIRFTIIDPRLYEVFTRYFAETTSPDLEMTLGGIAFCVEELTSVRGAHPWSGYSTFEGLLATAAAEPVVGLQFWSLTAFSLGSTDHGEPRYAILPEPALVFDGLLDRWNRFAPRPLAERQEWRRWVSQYVMVRGFTLRSDVWAFRRHLQVGFVGDCFYEVKGQWPDKTRQLNALAAFAFYAGVGMKTTMGMGQCRPWRR